MLESLASLFFYQSKAHLQLIMFKYLLLVSIMFASSTLHACDSCGSGGLTSGVGIFTGLQNNSVGLQYRFAQFESAPNVGSSTDYFHQWNLSGSVFLLPKWKIAFSVPIKYNYRLNDEEKLTLNGIGDGILMNSFVLFNDKPLKEKQLLYWDIGLGFQAPTGIYNPEIHKENLPENFNLGTGNWGLLFQSNLQYKNERLGLVLRNTFLNNTKTETAYLFGNQFNSTLSVFYRAIDKANFQLIPYGGMAFETTTVDTYPNGNTVHGTGGQGLFGSLGCQAIVRNMVFGLGLQEPIYQSFAQDEVLAKERFSLDFTIIF